MSATGIDAALGVRRADRRCDRCGAEAFVRVEISAGGDLLFCSHHYNRHELALLAHASRVIDERERLNARPSPSV